MLRFSIFFILLGWQAFCFSVEPSNAKLKALYNSLDPTSISQHLAFYELYSHHTQGEQALREAWKLLAGTTRADDLLGKPIPLSSNGIQTLVTLVNKPIDQELPLLDDETLKVLQHLSTRLPHYALKGHRIWSEEELLALPLEQIDVARGLFVTQFGNNPRKIQTYEALIDMMALQILARLPKGATPKEKITAINHFIFDEMGFRFPPHSLYAKDIDLYTFLPSVLDSRRGVCLGVSILYLCIAQRLALPTEMITPPGHIYVRYHSDKETINIETTARGIHIDSEEYLGLSTHALQKRNLQEVFGMAYFNQASVYWQNGEYEKVLKAYQKAEPYMADDSILKELMGYALILNGHKEEGEQKLKEIKDFIPDYAISKNTMAEDYLSGQIDANGIAVIFTKVDEDRRSVLAKKELLEKTLQKYPRFRSGILNLAVTWLQLHREGEALETLHTLQALDASDPEVHYYLSILYVQRHDYPKAWDHFHQVEAILKKHHYQPKALKELRRELLNFSPE